MRASSTRKILGLAIAGLWLVAMGLLVRRELGGTRVALETTQSFEPGESWLGLFTDGKRVGQIHLERRTEERGGIAGTTLDVEATMTLSLMGRPTDLDLNGQLWRQNEGHSAEVELAVRSAGYDFRMRGKMANGELVGEIDSAGETTELRLPLDEELVLGNGFGAALTLPRLEVGEEVRVDSLDPLTLQKSRAKVRCLRHETLNLAGETIAARLLSVETGGLTSRAWVDEGGEVVQAETPFGMVLRKIDPREVLTAETAEEVGEFLGATAIRPRGRKPFRGAKRMVIQVSGIEDLALPEDTVQYTIDPGRYMIATPSIPRGTAAVVTPGPPSELVAYLEPDPLVQSDHPKVRQRAAEITAGAVDPWERAERLHDWVYQEVAKEPVISIPSALEVLEKKRGDCNEHTVLFTALARAVGLPTRIAIGVVWSDDLDGFYYHAWPEVHLGEWLWIDPTLGQAVADATHVKLLNGGIETWTQLMPYLGRLEVEVLEID